jgi:hypothetical protein
LTPTEAINQIKDAVSDDRVRNYSAPYDHWAAQLAYKDVEDFINGLAIEDPVDKIRSLVCELGTNSERMATCPWLLVGSHAHARVAWDIYSDLLDRINKISPPC